LLKVEGAKLAWFELTEGSMMRLKAWVMVMAVFLVSRGGLARAEIGADLWTWLDITYWQEGPTRLHLFSHQAISEGEGPIVQLISPRVKHRALPWLELGAGLSALRIQNLLTQEFADQVRPEIEVSPLLKLGEAWEIHFRNRGEIRWDDWGGKPRPRLRHRLQVTRRLTGLGPLTAAYFSNEWLIEFDRGDWVENRLVPAAISLRLTEWAVVDFFFMQRSFRFDDGWRSDQIAGVFLKLQL